MVRKMSTDTAGMPWRRCLPLITSAETQDWKIMTKINQDIVWLTINRHSFEAQETHSYHSLLLSWTPSGQPSIFLFGGLANNCVMESVEKRNKKNFTFPEDKDSSDSYVLLTSRKCSINRALRYRSDAYDSQITCNQDTANDRPKDQKLNYDSRWRENLEALSCSRMHCIQPRQTCSLCRMIIKIIYYAILGPLRNLCGWSLDLIKGLSTLSVADWFNLCRFFVRNLSNLHNICVRICHALKSAICHWIISSLYSPTELLFSPPDLRGDTGRKNVHVCV